MRIIMMGTGPFAVPTLEQLYDSQHEVLALVTRPPRVVHGKSQSDVNPMRELARARGTAILEPESINSPEAHAELRRLAAELFVVCDYGQILAPETLAIAPHGGINLHASLLPKYRGAAPINWAIYHGEIETGVTVIHMTPKVDAGPAIAQVSTPIGPTETAAELEPRLAAIGAPLVVQCIALLTSGKAAAIAQDPSLASRARRLRKSDGEVDWRRSATAIANQVRALDPWPKTSTTWHRAGAPLRLILTRVAAEGAPADAAPGTVIATAGGQIVVATGEGRLRIEELQPAGKRSLSAAEFLRGYPLEAGQQLGPLEE